MSQSSQLQWDGSNKAFKAWAACVNDIPSSDGELDSDEEGGNPNWVAHANLTFSRQSRGNGQPSNVGQPPRPKEPQNGPAPISAPADPIAQMKNIVAAETERCLNHMRELLAKQSPTIDGNNKVANQSGQTQNGNHNNPHSRWGQGRWNIPGQVQCYNCQGFGHMAKECQNPKVLGEGDNKPHTIYAKTKCLCTGFCASTIPCLSSTVRGTTTGPPVCTE